MLLHYFRTGMTWVRPSNFTIRSSLKVGYRSAESDFVFSPWYLYNLEHQINWINYVDNPLSGEPNDFAFKDLVALPERHGVLHKSTYDLSQFYANVSMEAGWTFPVWRRFSLQPMAGAGFRYIDTRRPVESGNVSFTHNGHTYTDERFTYIVPGYIRAFDMHFVAETNIIYCISDRFWVSGGILADFTFGFMTIGQGNQYHLGLSACVKID